MNTIKHIILLACASTALHSAAQTLKKDITVLHDYEPEYFEVTRPGISPEITLPADTAKALAYSSRKVSVTPTAGIESLDAAPYADSLYTSPYRGYAALGFMPMFNLEASAGYKFLDTDRTRLNAWLQYDGNAYKGHTPLPGNGNTTRYVRNNTATVGVSLHHATGRESYLDLGTDYTFARFNTPACRTIANQNVNRLNVSGLWSGSNYRWNYGIGAEYGHFGYAHSLLPDTYSCRPVRENKFAAHTFASLKFDGGSSAGLAIDYSLIANTASSYADIYALRSFIPAGSYTHSRLRFTPGYRFDTDKFHFDLAAKIDFTFNSGKFFHIAPKASVTWIPTGFLKIFAKADGGEWQNTAGSLFDVTPYGIPVMAYSNSHIPITATIGATIGSWRGLYLQLQATYAIANDWLMPHGIADGTIFHTIDFKGYMLGISAGYKFRNIASIDIDYSTAPQKYDRGYYLWRDRARHVLDVSLTLNPIKDLSITLGWHYRSRRAQACTFSGSGTAAGAATILTSLGTIADLRAKALYRITPQWSIFLSGQNLANRHYILSGGMPAQGITGLAGVSYKF